MHISITSTFHVTLIIEQRGSHDVCSKVMIKNCFSNFRQKSRIISKIV